MKKTVKETSSGQASLLLTQLLPLAAMLRGDLRALVRQLGLHAIRPAAVTEMARVNRPCARAEALARRVRSNRHRGDWTRSS